jgi:hypothetical protein
VNTPDDVQLFQLDKPGIRRIDILSYKVGKGNPWAKQGEKHYERTFWTHVNVGPDGKRYVCPAKTVNKRCPICEEWNALQRTGDEDLSEEELKKKINSLAPKERQLFNVIDVEARDKGVQIWDFSYHLFGKLLDAELKNADEDEDFAFFCDLADGYTLKLGVGEKSFMGRQFREVETISFKARKDYPEEILDDLHCLDDLLIIQPYDKLKALFHQIEVTDDDDDDDEPEEKPRRSRREKEPEPDDEPEPEPKKESTADDYGLEEGDMVSFNDRKCEIVRISGDGTSITLEDEKGRKKRGVDPADCVKIKEEKEEEPEPEPEPEEEDDGNEEDKWDDWDEE